MGHIVDPYSVARAFRDPVTWLALIVDLIPIYAVLVLGWGAAPLVFLYWLENLIIGVFTIGRMIAAGLGQGRQSLGGIVFMVPFFVFHYGMFCFGHGIGLMILESGGALSISTFGESSIFRSLEGLIGHALNSGPQMLTLVAIIAGFNMLLFLWDFMAKGEFLKADMAREMFAPYGRIMLLHFALFAGMFALQSFGEPMLGVLVLIVLRAAWGILLSVRRRIRLDRKVDALS